MASRPLFSFGGCVYRMLVDARHAASLATLAALATVRDDGPQLASFDYEHTSNLYAGRMLWLRRQLDTKPRLKWAVSVDGDTTFTAQSLLHEMQHVDGQVAIGLAPVRIGGTETLCNLCITDEDEQISASLGADNRIELAPHHGRRMFMEDLQKVIQGDRRISSGGFGVAVFNLDWYRQAWKDPAPERASIDTGEDIEHCKSVRARGGGIIALNVRTDHYAWGERQTR
jgi:hypothetical protein